MALLGEALILRNRILARVNDKDASKTPDSEMVFILNEAQELMAQECVFIKRDQDLAAVASQHTYSLTTAFSDYVKLLGVYWNGNSTPDPMHPIGNVEDWEAQRRRTISLATGTPYFYTLDGPNLLVWPAPASSDADGFQVRYAYMPTAVVEDVAFTLPISTAWRPCYIYAGLWVIYDTAKPSPKTDLADKYWSLFQQQVRKLRASEYTGALSVRPG